MIEEVGKLIYLSIILIIGILIASFLGSFDRQVEQAAFYSKGYGCGVISQSKPYSVGREVGKTIFKQNCGICHNKNMKSRSTGPALRKAMDYWENDLVGLKRFLKDSNEYLDTTKVRRLLNMSMEYESSTNHKFDLNKEDIEALIAYIQ